MQTSLVQAGPWGQRGVSILIFTLPYCACLGRACGGTGVMAAGGKPPAGGVPEAGWGRWCLCAKLWRAGTVCCRKQNPKQKNCDEITKPFSVSGFLTENKSFLLRGRTLKKCRRVEYKDMRLFSPVPRGLCSVLWILIVIGIFKIFCFLEGEHLNAASRRQQ